MNIQKYLKKVAYIIDSDIKNDEGKVYQSKFDNSYITRVGMEDNVKFLADLNITKELTHGVGFSPKYNQWYGWSHRAIYGFKVGSTCKKGDCHYVGSTLEEQKEAAISFWEDEHRGNVKCIGIIKDDNKEFFNITWVYSNTTPNKKLKNNIGGTRHIIKPLGKGEWIAKTMADAKQMAIDFNKGVS